MIIKSGKFEIWFDGNKFKCMNSTNQYVTEEIDFNIFNGYAGEWKISGRNAKELNKIKVTNICIILGYCQNKEGRK